MKWKSIVPSLGSCFLGALLLVAAWAKATEPGAFVEQVQLEGLDFLFSSKTVALSALALETGLGMALLTGLRQLWILIPSATLISFFLFLTARNYWLVLEGLRDENSSCGCFGNLLERTPGEALWQDLFLLLPPLLLAFYNRKSISKSFPGIRLLLSAILAIGVVVFAAQNPDLHFIKIASEIGSSETQKHFYRTENYRLFKGKEEVLEAKIYESKASTTILIMIPQISTSILLEPRTRLFQTLLKDHILKSADGTLMFTPELVPQKQGQFEMHGDGIIFSLENLHFRLTDQLSQKVPSQ